MRIGTRAAWVYGLTLAGILGWVSALILAPYLRSRGIAFNSLIYAAFAPTCHQIPSRCFHLFGFPLAVCGRCFGIYAGFLAGMLTLPFFSGLGRTSTPRPWVFLGFTLPIGLDVFGNFFGLWSTGIWLRFATGAFWGALLPYYFVAGMNSLFALRKRHDPRPGLD